MHYHVKFNDDDFNSSGEIAYEGHRQADSHTRMHARANARKHTHTHTHTYTHSLVLFIFMTLNNKNIKCMAECEFVHVLALTAAHEKGMNKAG